MMRVQALLAQIAEVVLGDVALGSIVEDQVLLHAVRAASCLT